MTAGERERIAREAAEYIVNAVKPEPLPTDVEGITASLLAGHYCPCCWSDPQGRVRSALDALHDRGDAT